MSDSSKGNGHKVDLSAAQSIDRLCDEFEAALRDGSGPRIEDYLPRVDEEDREELLEQLVLVEVDLVDEPPSQEIYRDRFPDFAQAVARVFCTAEQAYEKVEAHRTAEESQIGPYKILKILGEGGMGTVYLAAQSHPVRRRVALKIIKAGMDSKQVIARFEAERQALSMMDHPNIAKVLDAGTTEGGRPYFAMEHVPGIPITDYCDRQRLSTRDRLKLFDSVCHALQHAHQKGIIHRDIKPSNVLVAEIDAKPVPKVIDFGLAKAMHTTLTDHTMVTQFNQTLGTVQYMSPEQTEVGALDVDTRTDIYSLGVMLYELLTGTTPLDRKSLADLSLDRVLVMIRETEATKPSSQLSNYAHDIESLCKQRRTEPRQLRRMFKGELDWIVMKALEKDRNRRYESAERFSDDIERYLANDVVLARPPTAGYRLRKFVRKNQVIVSSLAAAALFLLVATTISSRLYLRAEQARKVSDAERLKATLAQSRAERAQEEADAARVVADNARIAAEQSAQTVLAQAESTEEISAFLAELFETTRPASLVGIQEVGTDSGTRLDRIRDRYKNEPAVQAQLMYLVGDAFIGMGRIREAAPFATESLAIREQLVEQRETDNDEQELKLAKSLNLMAVIRLYQWRNERARELASRALEVHERHYGKTHQLSLESRVIGAFSNFQGKFMSHAGQKRVDGIAASLKEWESIQEIRRVQTDERNQGLANLKFIIAAHHATLASEERDTLSKSRHLLAAGKDAALAMNLGGGEESLDAPVRIVKLYAQVGLTRNKEKARSYCEEAIDLSTEMFFGNRNNPLSLFAQSLPTWYLSDDEAESIEKLERNRDGHLETYGRVPRTATVMITLANTLFKRYQSAAASDDGADARTQAILTFEEALAILHDSFGRPHWKVGYCQLELGTNLYDTGVRSNNSEDLDLAVLHLSKSLEIFRKTETVGYRWLDYIACEKLIDASARVSGGHKLTAVIDHLRAWRQLDADDPYLNRLVGKLPEHLRSLEKFVTQVEYGKDRKELGVFIQTADGWVERSNANGEFRFREVRRENDVIYLEDRSREIEITIDIPAKKIHLSQSGRTLAPYEILTTE